MSLPKATDSRTEPETSSATKRASPLRAVIARSAFWIVLLDVLLIAVFGVLSPEGSFFTYANFVNITLAGAQIVLLAIAQTMLLAAAKLDLSQGANLILSSVVAGQVMVVVTRSGGTPTAAVIVGAAAALLVGAFFGLVNGLLVGKLGINSLIITLGTLGIGTGIAYVITGGTDITGVPSELQSGFGLSTLLGIPAPMVLCIVLVAALWTVFAKSTLGVHTLAVGSSEQAARRGGIRVHRQIVILFVISGALAGIAGLIDLSRFDTTNISGHQTDALASISAAVIGGTSLFGGVASLTGSIAGAFLAVILRAGLVIMGLPPFYQTIAFGAILIIAVALDRVRTIRAKRS